MAGPHLASSRFLDVMQRVDEGFWPKSSIFIIIDHYFWIMRIFNGRRKVILILLLHISIVGRF